MTVFLSDDETKDHRKMVDELLEVDSGLSDKEIGFLDKMYSEWSGNFTEGQGNWIKKIYRRVL